MVIQNCLYNLADMGEGTGINQPLIVFQFNFDSGAL